MGLLVGVKLTSHRLPSFSKSALTWREFEKIAVRPKTPEAALQYLCEGSIMG